jgi:hypothetical protein
MIRRAAVVVVMLLVSASPLYAQSTVLTVRSSSANVHKSPSTGSPVVGKAPRGAMLEVTRELGSWVRVSWPDVPEGVGFVHLTAGSIQRGSDAPASRTSAAGRSRPTTQSGAAQTAQAGQGAGLPSAAPSPYVLPTHVVGVGARVGGSALAFGGSARAWRRGRLGFQVEVSRHSMTSTGVTGRVTSTQFTPSALYSFRDRVTNAVWIRPYLGAGIGLHHQTLSGVTPGSSTSDNGLGLQAFGGAEITLASVPRLALSADLGYYGAPSPFAGFEPGGMGMSLAAHWYLR